MYRKLAIMISFLVILCSLLTSCYSNSSVNRSSDELIAALGAEPEAGFDPMTGWGSHAGSLLFQSTLLKRDHDLQITGDLATNYRISADGLVWTFELRDDVRFSDGEPLTASDVVYTYNTLKANATVFDLTVLEQVRMVNPTTVEMVLKHPQSTFINLAATIGIVPAHAHDANYSERPIGSGPFRFVQWDKGQQLIVEPNPHYYGTKSEFSKITFLYLSEEAALAAAKVSQVDIAAVTPSLAKQTIPGMKLVSLQSVDNRGIAFPFVKSGEATEKGYPIGNDVTADEAIRKAVNVAVDRQALVDGILEGYGSPAYTVSDGLPWWNPESVIQDGDIERASQILADAGWKDSDGDGILEKDEMKARFTLLYPASDRVRQSLAIAAADRVKELGIHIDVEGKSWDDIYRLMHSNAALMGWGAHDPLEMYNLYSGTTRGFEAFNPGYYYNETVDMYLNRALTATSEEEANEYWKKAQWDGETGLSARGDAPWAWLVNMDHLYYVRDDLDIGKQKVHPHGMGWPITDNIEHWKWHESEAGADIVSEK